MENSNLIRLDKVCIDKLNEVKKELNLTTYSQAVYMLIEFYNRNKWDNITVRDIYNKSKRK